MAEPVAGGDRMRDMVRVARAIRELNASVTNEVREPIERKIRRWQHLRMPDLAPEVKAVRPYDLAWPVLFSGERKRLQALLGGEAGAIEHIGSTSIPGMASKSILDLLVAVPEIPPAVAALAAAGYEHYGVSPCDHEAFWLWDVSPAGHAFVVHLCAAGNPWIRTALNFRDYMRAHPEECASYEELKHRLGAERSNLLEYSIVKLKLFYELSGRADAWVAAGGTTGSL
ncbi:MAG: GrpB family protein [Acidobacteria bacterium]|nr:GrpB family protein [Acidobacteriota bacterium]